MDLRDIATEAHGRYKTTQSMIADGLRRGILSGALPSGMSLRQEDVAKDFDVSRIPVREALRQLEGERLVKIHPHRGATVTALSLEEVTEVTDIREVLETLAVRKAVPRISEADLSRAERVLESIDGEKDIDVVRWTELNWAFHHALYAPAQRPMLLAMAKNQQDIFGRYACIHLDIGAYRQRAQKDHYELIGLCKQKDAEAVAQLVSRHIRDVGRLVIEAFEKGPA